MWGLGFRVYISTYVYTHICMYTHKYIHAYCTQRNTNGPFIFIYAHAYIHSSIHTWNRIYVQTCIHTQQIFFKKQSFWSFFINFSFVHQFQPGHPFCVVTLTSFFKNFLKTLNNFCHFSLIFHFSIIAARSSHSCGPITFLISSKICLQNNTIFY